MFEKKRPDRVAFADSDGLRRNQASGIAPSNQLMFEAFPQSVGVANIRRFASELTHWPRYVTQGDRGAGFAEVAHAVLAVRC